MSEASKPRDVLLAAVRQAARQEQFLEVVSAEEAKRRAKAEEEQRKREHDFAGYTVDRAMMARAAQDAIFLHCLPAHRGEEVTSDVIDGAQSRVWDEAENRLHVQKAIMAALIGGEPLA